VNWTLEVLCLPVTDVDRAKEFYGEKLGFTVDVDSQHGTPGLYR
jgi:catechol 2,3-dioxygenase-like lactoylglutathione lyase family enzyme